MTLHFYLRVCIAKGKPEMDFLREKAQSNSESVDSKDVSPSPDSYKGSPDPLSTPSPSRSRRSLPPEPDPRWNALTTSLLSTFHAQSREGDQLYQLDQSPREGFIWSHVICVEGATKARWRRRASGLKSIRRMNLTPPLGKLSVMRLYGWEWLVVDAMPTIVEEKDTDMEEGGSL